MNPKGKKFSQCLFRQPLKKVVCKLLVWICQEVPRQLGIVRASFNYQLDTRITVKKVSAEGLHRSACSMGVCRDCLGC